MVRAKQEFNISILKGTHKQAREQCALLFRNEAHQGNPEEVQDLEGKLRGIISAKYREIKQEFIRYCQNISKHFLDEEAQRVRRNIQQGTYSNFDEAYDAL